MKTQYRVAVVIRKISSSDVPTLPYNNRQTICEEIRAIDYPGFQTQTDAEAMFDLLRMYGDKLQNERQR